MSQESIEESIARSMYMYNNEKTFIDKLTAKEDVKRMRELHGQLKNSREQITEMLQLMVGNESKLLNFEERERHILAKYMIRITESFDVSEKIWDVYFLLQANTRVRDDVLKAWSKNIEQANRTCKFYVNNFLYLSRSGMSIKGVGFEKILRNRFEISYEKPPAQQENKGVLGFLKR